LLPLRGVWVSMAGKKVCFGEFELDFGRFQLFRNGQPVRLEGLPLQLLMFLTENQRQLVTREQIADQLWGKDVFVDSEQGINTAIRKIRRALDDDSAQPQYLQTVVGRGYRFVGGGEEEGRGGAAGEERLSISPEDLGRAIMAAAGLEPNDPKKE
jgi:DNA-binding winged helix-turn-helix (wHTH) protein